MWEADGSLNYTQAKISIRRAEKASNLHLISTRYNPKCVVKFSPAFKVKNMNCSLEQTVILRLKVTIMCWGTLIGVGINEYSRFSGVTSTAA